MWRLFVSFAASVLGAVLLLRGPADMPRTYLPVPLLPIAAPQAPLITIPPGPLAMLPPVIEPDWGEALAVAMAHPSPPHRRPTLIAHSSTHRAVALGTHPPGAPPALSPIGRVFAWLSAHAVRTAISNDQVAGG